MKPEMQPKRPRRPFPPHTHVTCSSHLVSILDQTGADSEQCILLLLLAFDVSSIRDLNKAFWYNESYVDVTFRHVSVRRIAASPDQINVATAALFLVVPLTLPNFVADVEERRAYECAAGHSSLRDHPGHGFVSRQHRLAPIPTAGEAGTDEGAP